MQNVVMHVCLCIVSSCTCVVKNSETPDVCVCMCSVSYTPFTELGRTELCFVSKAPPLPNRAGSSTPMFGVPRWCGSVWLL